MPRIKSPLRACLMIGVLGLLVFAGKQGGKQLARSGILHRSVPAGKTPAGDNGPPRQVSVEPVRAELVASSIQRLIALAKGSPNLGVDWEAQAQMDSIIAKLSAAELAEVFASIDSPGDQSFRILAGQIGIAWMAKDPDPAMKAVLEKFPRERFGRYFAAMIFGGWADEHPEAAFAWLNDAELPEDPPGLKKELRQTALRELAERDFSLASAEFLKMERSEEDTSDYGGLMQNWGAMYADDPAMRDRLVEFAKYTGHPEDYAQLNYQLLREWPQEDSMGMMNYLQELRGYLESDAVPAASRPQVDATAVAVAVYREYDRPALEWWMERYGQSSETPTPLREAMSDWAQKYPDAMFQWFEEQPSSPQRDALVSSVIPTLINQKKFTEAAGSIASMQDPGRREAAIERLDFLWREQDPDAAAAWRASLPQGTLPGPADR